MIQTCCALSRKHSAAAQQQEKRKASFQPQPQQQPIFQHQTSSGSSQSSSVTVVDEFSPTEDRSIGLLDCSNLSLEELPLELITAVKRGPAEELKHLILDENQLDEQALESIPELPALETLSLNGNCVKNIGVLLQILCRKAPHLKCLSLIGNPGWPHPILGGGRNLQLYRKYALSAVQLLPTLQFLDTARVSPMDGSSGVIKASASGNSHKPPLGSLAKVCRVV